MGVRHAWAAGWLGKKGRNGIRSLDLWPAGQELCPLGYRGSWLPATDSPEYDRRLSWENQDSRFRYLNLDLRKSWENRDFPEIKIQVPKTDPPKTWENHVSRFRSEKEISGKLGEITILDS